MYDDPVIESNVAAVEQLLNITSSDLASHPLNGWIWFGKGLRCYDNW